MTSPTGTSTPNGARGWIELLVALPQSGRTRWLTERARELAGAEGPEPLWIADDARGSVPAGVEPIEPGALADAAAARVIALDDLHLVPEAELGRLRDHLDSALERGAVVLATSVVVPDESMASWAEQHQVRWLRQDDLRVDERDYADALVPKGLLARHARRLHRALDGWAGPLAAPAEAQRGGSLDERALARAAVDRAQRDLTPFLDAVGPVPPGLSLLPAISASLLDDLLDDDERASWLRVVDRFVPPAIGVDIAVRPHPVLRRIFELVAPPGPDAHDLREQAMAWYLDRDRVTDAVRVLIEDQRPREALDLIRQHQLTIVYHDGRHMQRRLMDELPRGSWSAADHLMYAVACGADGDHRRATFVLTSPVLADPALPVELAIARDSILGYLGMLSHPPELSIEAGRRALTMLDQLPADAALPHVHLADTHHHFRSGTLTHIARNQILLGSWEEAVRTLEEAGRCGHPLLDHFWVMYRAWAHGLRGEAAEAERLATRALDAADFWPEIHVIAVEARLALAEVHLLHGRIAAARELAEQAVTGALARRSDNQLACALVAVAEAELRAARPTDALAALDGIGDGAYGFIDRRAKASRARSLLAGGRPHDVEPILRPLALDQHTILAHAQALAAGLDGPVTADDLVAWEPPPWPSARLAHVEALAALGEGSPAPRRRPTGHGARPRPASSNGGRSRAADRVAAAHGLSDREAEILQALLGEATLVEVAEDLGISINTLKTHLRRAYRKLDVHGRDEAIELVARSELDPT